MVSDGLGPWLERHGLGVLAPVLAAHDVGLDLLPHLSEADLKELGLTLGQRRRLELALRAGGTGPTARPQAEPRAERRRLTVLFVDLVGSTALSARLDPEELRELIRGFQNAAAGEIARFAGHLAKFMGDGALAYFGWPTAHEDDAERAVRAALAILLEVGRIDVPGGKWLAARAGIATGPVVVEDGTGSGAEAETGISGETPNLAARLQALAGPGEVVIAEATRRLIGGLFTVADLGPRQLKGFGEPQRVFRIAAVRPIESRFDARHEATALAPILGRDAEVALLLDHWRKAEGGAGSLVLIKGEAGLGKSRLVRSLQRRLADRPHVRLRYQCSPFHADTALWPVTEQLVHAAGIEPDDQPQTRLAKLRSLLARGAPDPEAALPLVAHLLGLDGEGTEAVAALPAAERRRQLLDALVAQLVGLARQAPLLLVLEDAHWIDPTTSELFDLTFQCLPELPVLAVATHRPEHNPSWRALPQATELALRPLNPAAAAAIVAQVAPNLPDPVVAAIVAKADGVPLFIEEVARAVADSSARELEPGLLAVPASLHDTLMARLDRLGGARRVAQIGAAIGRVFPHGLLAQVAELPEDRLGPALADLVASDLVSRRGSGADATYLFKHALVQDAAYDSLLRSHRREIHGRIAAALSAEPGVEPELLAHHLTAAGQTIDAIEAWRQAARRAVARSANQEAARHLGRTLELLAALPETAERERTELAVRLELAVPLIAVHGFGSEHVAACGARVRDVAERIGDEAQRFAALRVAWNSTLMREPLPRAVGLATELMRLADAGDDPAQLALAHRALGYSLCMSGRQREALPLLERGIALADAAGDAAFGVYGEHPGAVCRFYSAWSLALAGDVAGSEARGDEAVALARRLGNPHGLAWALVCAGVPALFTGDAARALKLETEALAIAEAYRLPQWTGFAKNYGGWAQCQGGETERGLASITAGLELVHATGAVLNTTVLLWTRAQCRLAAGDLAGARADIDAALAHAEGFGEGIVLADLLRLDAEVIRLTGGLEDIAGQVESRALAIAREQGSERWALR